MGNLEEARVFHSQHQTHYYISINRDKVEELFRFIEEHRQEIFPTKEQSMPGISGPAALAMERIFNNVPHQFPLIDLVKYLHFDYLTHEELPFITYAEMEAALIRWYCAKPGSHQS